MATGTQRINHTPRTIMSEQITQRVTRSLKEPALIELLSRLPGADLHSLLLSVLKRRVSRIEPAPLKGPNSVSQASDTDSRFLHELEHAAYRSASTFDAVELSPLLPLGALA